MLSEAINICISSSSSIIISIKCKLFITNITSDIHLHQHLLVVLLVFPKALSLDRSSLQYIPLLYLLLPIPTIFSNSSMQTTNNFMLPCYPTATTLMSLILQSCLVSRHTWFCKNGIVPYPWKSDAIGFSTSQRLRSSPLMWQVRPFHSLTKLRFLESLWIHASPWARMLDHSPSQASTIYVPLGRYVHL